MLSGADGSVIARAPLAEGAEVAAPGDVEGDGRADLLLCREVTEAEGERLGWEDVWCTGRDGSPLMRVDAESLGLERR